MKKVVAWWRRSIQLRVVTQTVVLSTIIIAITTMWLIGRIAEGMTSNRVDAAIGEAESGFIYAQQNLDASAANNQTPTGDDLNDVINRVIDRTGPDRRFEIVLEGPLVGESQRPIRSSSLAVRSALPNDLTKSVEADRGTLWSFTSMQVDRETVPSVAIGSQIYVPSSGDSYAMYYVFPLADLVATLELIQRTIIAGSLGMIFLVGGVAWLMSRQVLTPVRMVRRVAEDFSGGHLEQRLSVKGDDDIARLGTSFNQMAENIQAQISRLEELSRLQQQFVSDVSHELRTPLATVSMASEMLYEQRDQYDSQSKRAIELLKEQLDHYEHLLVDLLEISYFDAGAAVLDTVETDLVVLVNRVIANLGVPPGNMELVLETDVPVVNIDGDRRRLERIVRNLIGNAFNHSRAKTVRVKMNSDPDSVTLRVIDDGVGIAAKDLDFVFERFWRADPSRTGESTGLGLAIAREDAELHGGALVVNSQVGSGTEFVLTLPKQLGEEVSR